jgi:hypothetical protein
VIHPDLIQQGRVTEHCRAMHRENGDNSTSIAYFRSGAPRSLKLRLLAILRYASRATAGRIRARLASDRLSPEW